MAAVKKAIVAKKAAKTTAKRAGVKATAKKTVAKTTVKKTVAKTTAKKTVAKTIVKKTTTKKATAKEATVKKTTTDKAVAETTTSTNNVTSTTTKTRYQRKKYDDDVIKSRCHIREPKPGKLFYYVPSSKILPIPPLSQLADQGEIYCIRNNRTGFRYIGQTKCIKRVGGKEVYKGYKHRFKQHIYDALKNIPIGGKRKVDVCPLLYKAIRLHGKSMFYIKLIERCPRSQLNQREIHFIKLYQTRKYGYNISSGGQRFRKRR